MRFIDEATLAIKAGNGGNGMVAFRRERRIPRGGPSGGDGGRGGDVIFKASRNLGTLLDLRHRPQIAARRGGDGGNNDCNGRSAEDLEILVPVGTIIYDDDTDELLGDLTEHDQVLVAAGGGRGGLGNIHFATSSNRAPRKALPGEPGQERVVRLELRLLAEVGLLGLPNVGKSTLISHLSAAKPKVADYPFTTLVPNLGVVQLGPGASFVMADIPGIIRGAADGAGLGIRFLRHVQRTAVLLHMLAPTEGEDDLIQDFDDLSNEVTRFDSELAARPRLVALNKADLPDTLEIAPGLENAIKDRGYEMVIISAATGQGLDKLKARLGEMIRAQKLAQEKSDQESSNELADE
jgi:GTPase